MNTAASNHPQALDDLSNQRFLRYWQFFAIYNVVSSLAETMGAFVLFVVLQGLFSDTQNSLTSYEITLLAIGTAVGLAVFGYAQRNRARAAIEEHILRFLPPPFFENRRLPYLQETSETIAFSERKDALERIRKAATRMAQGALVAYTLWGAIVALLFSRIGPWWVIVLSCVIIGSFMARLYYSRLRQLDFEPLLALEWGRDPEHGILFDEHHMYAQKTLVNRAKFKQLPKSKLHELTIRHAQWKARVIVRVVAGLRIMDGFPVARASSESQASSLRRLDARINKAVGLRQAHTLWEAFVSIVIVGLFFFAVTKGSTIIGLGQKMNPSIVACVMVLLVSFLYLPRLLTFITIVSGRDGADPYERVTAEAFGLITEKAAEDEYYGNEGRFDEKTGLLRYGVFYRKTIDVLIRMVAGMTRNGDAEQAPEEPLPGQYDPSKLNDFSLILFDIDNFKVFNSIFGYMVADQVLSAVANVLVKAARGHSGMAGRFGGEEFCILVPGLGSAAAKVLAETVRKRISESVIVERLHDGRIRVVLMDGGFRDGAAVLWISETDKYGDDLDPDERFPSAARTEQELDKYEHEAGGNDTGALPRLTSLERSKAEPLRRLISGDAGHIWTTTVSAGVGGGVDLYKMLGMRLNAEDSGKVNYVSTFRRLFARLNGRINAAKFEGRNRVKA